MPQDDILKAADIQREEVTAIRRVMAKLTPLAVGALVQNLISSGTSSTEKRKSAELILAYGWGRPVTTTVLEAKASTNIIIDQQMADRISDTFKRIDQALGPTGGMPTDVNDILRPILELEGMIDLEEAGNDTALPVLPPEEGRSA